jgi:hypothetical protein
MLGAFNQKSVCICRMSSCTLARVVGPALLHDLAAIEDFSRVAEHHELGAPRATTILRELGFPEPGLPRADHWTFR